MKFDKEYYKSQIKKFKEHNKKFVVDYRQEVKEWVEFRKKNPQVLWKWQMTIEERKKYDDYRQVLNSFLETMKQKYYRTDTSDRRYYHVAYSLMKGKKYSQIEPKVKEDNKISIILVERAIQKFFPEVTLSVNEDKTEFILGVNDVKNVCDS